MKAKIIDKSFSQRQREKARAEDSEFQYQVGKCYCQGIGIEQNYSEAVKWLNLSVKQGNSRAQCDLGSMYYNAEGVAKDYKKAVELFRLAVEQEDARAQNNLAVCYEYGEGVLQEYNEAIRLYNHSAKQGYWRASENLGKLYQYGKGVEKDLAQAKKHYEKALADSEFLLEPTDVAEFGTLVLRIKEIDYALAEAEAKATAASKAERTEVFISYAREDKVYRDELCQYLKATKIKWWDDTQIKPGEKWGEKIKEALSKAKVAILIVSVNFFASDYIWDEEYPSLLEAAENEGATILWLPISAFDYDDTGIAKYQSVMNPESPLEKCTRAGRNEVYMELAKRIKELYKIQPA